MGKICELVEFTKIQCFFRKWVFFKSDSKGHPQPCVKQSPGVIVSALFFTTARGVCLDCRNLGGTSSFEGNSEITEILWSFSKMFGNEKDMKIIRRFVPWEALQHPHNLNYEGRDPMEKMFLGPSGTLNLDRCGSKAHLKKKSYGKNKRRTKKTQGTFYHSRIFEVYSDKPRSYGLTHLPFGYKWPNNSNTQSGYLRLPQWHVGLRGKHCNLLLMVERILHQSIVDR